MKIIYAGSQVLPSEFQHGIAATIGFFDGVHLGHRYLINQLKKLATGKHVPSAVITFFVHPLKVLEKAYQPLLLTTFEEKLEQLESTGVDLCIVMNFTKELSEFTAENFIGEILHKSLNITSLLIGYDHKFGKNRTDGFKEYKRYGEYYGMDIVPACPLESEKGFISSSMIRRLLSKGQVKEAGSLLSYFYQIRGKVVPGNKMGREMGYPTANIALTDEDKLLPQDGIYAVYVSFDGIRKQGMLYLGTRPTLFGHGEHRIEVNIFDYKGDLYDKELTITFLEFLRGDRKFNFVQDLENQLRKDKADSLKVIKELEEKGNQSL